MTATMLTKVNHCSYPNLGNAARMLVLDDENDIPYVACCVELHRTKYHLRAKAGLVESMEIYNSFRLRRTTNWMM